MEKANSESGLFAADSKRSVIVETLRREIALGKYAVNERFPSEQMLMRRFKVARATVSGALAELKREGILRVKIGSGAYVTSMARGKGEIGLFLSGRGDVFESLRRSIEREAGELGYTIVSSEVPKGAAAARTFANQCAERRVAGVVLETPDHLTGMNAMTDDILSILKTADIPVVLVELDTSSPQVRNEYDIVGIDYLRAGGLGGAKVGTEELGKVALHTLVDRISHRDLPPREILLAPKLPRRRATEQKGQ